MAPIKRIKPKYFRRGKKKATAEHKEVQSVAPKHPQPESHQNEKKPRHSVINRGIFGKWKLSLPEMKPKWAVIGILVILGIVWNYFIGVGLFKTFRSWSHVVVAREKLAEEMTLWENISQKYPTYRDAYVQGAIDAYRLGDKGKESYFLSKLQLLDPNFPLTKTLGQLMNLQNLNQ